MIAGPDCGWRGTASFVTLWAWVALVVLSGPVGCGDDAPPPVEDEPDAALPMYFEPGEGPGADAEWALDGEGAADADRVDFEVRFDVRVGDDSAACGPLFGPVGRADSRVAFRDMRFFVHDLALIRPDGTGVRARLAEGDDFQGSQVALLDFENGSEACDMGDTAQNRRVKAAAPAGTYVGLAFRVGVPEQLNHADLATADPPLDRTGLHWGWRDGYKFMRIDATAESGSPIEFHLGSTLCNSVQGTTVCQQPNRPAVALLAFSPKTQAVVLDYGALVADVDLEEDIGGCVAGTAPDICGRMLAPLGIDPGTGQADPSAQTVFRAATSP